MVKYLDDDDDDEIVADGGSVRCPLYLCDATQRAMVAKYGAFDANDHKPHHGELTPELRELRASTRTQYLQQLSDAWKSPAQRGGFQLGSKPDSGGSSTSDARTGARDARNEMIKRAVNAWRRTPSRDAAEPDNSSPPEVMRRHLAEEPDAAASQRRRDQIYADYRDRLQNAWKTTVVGFGPVGPVGAGP